MRSMTVKAANRQKLVNLCHLLQGWPHLQALKHLLDWRLGLLVLKPTTTLVLKSPRTGSALPHGLTLRHLLCLLELPQPCCATSRTSTPRLLLLRYCTVRASVVILILSASRSTSRTSVTS